MVQQHLAVRDGSGVRRESAGEREALPLVFLLISSLSRANKNNALSSGPSTRCRLTKIDTRRCYCVRKREYRLFAKRKEQRKGGGGPYFESRDSRLPPYSRDSDVVHRRDKSYGMIRYDEIRLPLPPHVRQLFVFEEFFRPRTDATEITRTASMRLPE